MTTNTSTSSPEDLKPTFDYFTLANTIEHLLARRRAELDAGHPRAGLLSWLGQREWTVSEMQDTIFGSFKHMKKGGLRHAPVRPKIMDIADYLECDLDERNILLAIARHAVNHNSRRGCGETFGKSSCGMLGRTTTHVV
jgi:hypothetical protein